MSTANGVSRQHGQARPSSSSSPRAPRRIVVLAGEKDSPVREVLREYTGEEVSGKLLHEDLQRFAAEHGGEYVAAEWMGPLGWTRFLWCRKEKKAR